MCSTNKNSGNASKDPKTQWWIARTPSCRSLSRSVGASPTGVLKYIPIFDFCQKGNDVISVVIKSDVAEDKILLVILESARFDVRNVIELMMIENENVDDQK